MDAGIGMRRCVAVFAGLFAASGCGDDGASQTTDDAATTATSGASEEPTGAEGADETEAAPATRPNWHEDVAPLIARSCEGCHSAGSIAPFPLEDYEQTSPFGAAIMLQVEAGLMPPWHAVETDDCQPPASFKHDARLSDDEIQMLRDWVDAGTPEGDPALAAPIPEPPSQDLVDPTVTVTMEGSLTIEAQDNVLDFFHCLSFDPGNDEDVYISGMQVVPGNRSIAHHTLIYVDVAGESAAWENGQSFDCGGGAGDIDEALLIGGWVPGSLPIETPEDVGILLPAGARIVYNMHYHASVTGPESDDATGIALRWTETPPEYVSQFQLIGAPAAGDVTTQPFMIPAGASGHEEIAEYEVPPIGQADVRVWSVLNHMHRVGVDMRTSVIRGNDETCLLQTPDWDFDWQRFYEYDVEIADSFRVQAGDIVRVHCTYDNTLDNPDVVSALAEVGLDEPQDVYVGEGTLDEMCLTGVGVAYRFGP